MSGARIAIVGGGLAGLMTAIKICEEGHAVDIYSIVPVRRSHSVCAQGGINAAVNIKGEGDSPETHFYETIKGGDFLATQDLPKGMCEAAPSIIYMFDRMGVMFNRTPEGNLDFRRFGGTLFHRTAFAGATTGQQLLYALDEQVRRYEAEGLVRKFEYWHFLSAVIDDQQICRGLVAMNRRTMEVKAVRYDAVVIASGGCGMIFGKSTNSTICTGDAAAAVFQQGVTYANGEFIQIHPTSIPGDDKYRLISEAARGEGGRVWVYKDGKPFYFLEEWYPKYGNLVPRDVASRAIHKAVFELGLGIDGEAKVYLDLSHIDTAELNRKLGGIMEIYEKFAGGDPRKIPMKVFPSVHYTMGGLYIDNNHMTNIPGLLAGGECDYQYHGANRLGANSLLSCVYAGMVAGPAAVNYVKNLQKDASTVSDDLYRQNQMREEEFNQSIMKREGTINPHVLHGELGDLMTEHVTVVRHNEKLKSVDEKLKEMIEKWKHVELTDKGAWANNELIFVRQLHHMLHLARVITIGALNRNESRGSHYKPEFPDRDDKNWMKTTKATWTPTGPTFDYEPVEPKYIKPVLRNYAS